MQRTGWDREVLRHLDTLYREGALGNWADACLVEHFARDGSDRAFAALVERHGGRVLRVCRSVTGDRHAAEDAFQATFLVLARKAGSLRVGASLAPWLHAVAVRVASAARSVEARRKRHEARAAGSRREFGYDRVDDADLSRVLQLEIGRLPALQREVVLLCDLEGLSHEDAARRLVLPVGTVKSRLSRGRERLRSRLVRRGVAPTAIVAACGRSAPAWPSAALREATVSQAVSIGSGGAAAGMVPAAVIALYEGGLSAMFLVKLRAAVAALALIATATTAVVFAQSAVDRAETPTPASSAAAAADSPATPPAPARPEAPVVVADDSSHFDPPGEDEIWTTFLKERYKNRRFLVTFESKWEDPPKDYPLAGKCRLVHEKYKCTIAFHQTVEGKTTPGAEVIYITKQYLRRDDGRAKASDEPDGGLFQRAMRDRLELGLGFLVDEPDGGLFQRAMRDAGARNPERPSDPAEPRANDQEARLQAVERKLDRILKAVEGSAAPKGDAAGGARR